MMIKQQPMMTTLDRQDSGETTRASQQSERRLNSNGSYCHARYQQDSAKHIVCRKRRNSLTTGKTQQAQLTTGSKANLF